MSKRGFISGEAPAPRSLLERGADQIAGQRAALLTSRIKKRQAGSESTVVRYLTVFIADTVAPARV